MREEDAVFHARPIPTGYTSARRMGVLEAAARIVQLGGAESHRRRAAEMRAEFVARTGAFSPEDPWFEERSRAFWCDAVTRGRFGREVEADLAEEDRAWLGPLERAHRGLFQRAATRSSEGEILRSTHGAGPSWPSPPWTTSRAPSSRRPPGSSSTRGSSAATTCRRGASWPSCRGPCSTSPRDGGHRGRAQGRRGDSPPHARHARRPASNGAAASGPLPREGELRLPCRGPVGSARASPRGAKGWKRPYINR